MRVQPWMLALGLCLVAGCSSKINSGDGGSNPDGSTSDTVVDNDDAGVPIPDVLTDTGSGQGFSEQPACADVVTACSDGEDQEDGSDPDDLIDMADPECVGPCDNDEGSFATGIPGDNSDACKQDCFFDGNSGSGDDKCNWNLKCDPEHLGGACPYNENYSNCPTSQTQPCIDFCQAYTPSGCDCFGCCTVFKNGNPYTIYIGEEGCTTESLGTPETTCTSCTLNQDCGNVCTGGGCEEGCGRCELCLGRTVDDLPADCDEEHECSGGRQVCNTASDCTVSSGQTAYCVTGCCQISTPIE